MKLTPRAKEILRRIGSLLVGTVIALVMGEAVVRVMASRSLIYNIEMVRYAKELKEPDPRGEVSHVHRTNASAHLMGVDIALNSLGHRGPELINPKPADKKRVLVLGSSVTFGWGVPLEGVFTSIVQKRFETEHPDGATTLEFANAGIGNYNTTAQTTLFNRQYPVVKPDLVVLHYFISDPEPRPPARNSLILRHSFFAAYCYDRIKTIGLAAEGKTDLFKHYSEVYDDGQPYWTDTLNRIATMRDQAAKDGVPTLIMIIPDFHNLANGTPYESLYAKMEKGFSDRKLTTINTVPVYQKRYAGKESELWIQPDDPHPNAKGHEVMADVLYDSLSKPGAFALRTTTTTPTTTNDAGAAPVQTP
jgi:lysophospholipase L1-like esterase